MLDLGVTGKPNKIIAYELDVSQQPGKSSVRA
ncbi:MAG: hypothetical protein ACE1ZA_22325 [Pseudomonadales bacterium]